VKILIRRKPWDPVRWYWAVGVTPDCEKAFRCYLTSVYTRENNSLKAQFGKDGKQLAAVRFSLEGALAAVSDFQNWYKRYGPEGIAPYENREVWVPPGLT
jgi:hypothetical protein